MIPISFAASAWKKSQADEISKMGVMHWDGMYLYIYTKVSLLINDV